MNERNTFYRKLGYLGAMAVLLVPLSMLGLPNTRNDAGGTLAQKRDAHGLGQANLGDIDPASETMKLATLGLRAVAVNVLWERANNYKKKENWSKLTATLDQLAKLQPNFITFWKYQSWNQSYNLSVEFDDYRDRYYYVKRGIQFLEEGNKYNRDNPALLWELGWFTGQKIGRADEKIQYRRLFQADNEYHDERPMDQRDNWLVSREWYIESVRAADDKQRGIGRKSPIVFYSSAPKSQMFYSEAIEEEGKFEKAVAGWKTAEGQWREFGAMELQHSTGALIRFADQEKLTQELTVVDKQLAELAPEITAQLANELEQQLTDEQRAARDKPADQRNRTEVALAAEAERMTTYEATSLAERISEQRPELRREALLLGAERFNLNRRIRFIRNYKDTANYDYWLTRTEFEQTDAALTARQLIFEGHKAFTEQLDPIKAKELYVKGLASWRDVLDAFPVLQDRSGTTGDDVMVYVTQYKKVLDQLDEEIPDDFPLWDIIENFDVEQDFVEELAAYKSRTQSEADSPASDQAQPSVQPPAQPPAEPPAEPSAEPAREESPAKQDVMEQSPTEEEPTAETESDTASSEESSPETPSPAEPSSAEPSSEEPSSEDSSPEESSSGEEEKTLRSNGPLAACVGSAACTRVISSLPHRTAVGG